MLTYFVNFLTGLLRWIIITYLFKPVVDWVIINPLSEVLQGGSPVNVIEGSVRVLSKASLKMLLMQVRELLTVLVLC